MEYLRKLSRDMLIRLRKKFTYASRADIEDAIQDSMVKYLEKFGNLDNITPQWLYQAASNRLIDIYRHNSRSTSGCPEQVSYDDGPTMVNIAADSQREAVSDAANTLAHLDEN